MRAQCRSYHIKPGNFCVTYFHIFREFCLVVKLNFTKYCHTFYVAHIDHSQKSPSIQYAVVLKLYENH